MTEVDRFKKVKMDPLYLTKMDRITRYLYQINHIQSQQINQQSKTQVPKVALKEVEKVVKPLFHQREQLLQLICQK